MFGSRSRGRSAPYVSPIVTLPLAPSYSTPADAPTLQAGMHTFNPAFTGITPGGSAPQIANANVEGIPGSALTFAGDSFTSNTTIRFYSQTHAGNATALADATQIDTDSANVRVVQVPASHPENSLILAYPYDTVNGYGNPWVINRAFASRIQTTDTGSSSGYVGGSAYIFGKNLTTSTCFIYIDGHGYVTPTYADSERVEFVIPSLSLGTYNVWVHNGRGGAYGWSLASVPLVVTDAATLKRNYSANSIALVCPNDPAVDSKTAIDAAIATIAAGATSGEIVLGAGDWYISGPSAYAANNSRWIRIRGQGPTTIMHRKAGFSNDLFFNFNNVRGAVADMTINLDDGVGTSTTGRDASCILGALEIDNVTIDGRNIANWMISAADATTGVVVKNCTITGWPIYMNKPENVLIVDCDFVLSERPDTAVFFSKGKNLAVVDCDVNHVDYTDVTAYDRGFRAVVFDCTAGRQRDCYVGGCTTHKMWALSGYGDAENVLCDGGGGTFRAAVTGATGTTVKVATTDYSAISANTRYAVIVKGKGTGQWSEITGISVDGSDTVLALDRTWKVIPDTTSWVHVNRQMEGLVVSRNTFQGNSDYTANTCAVHLFNGGLGCLITTNAISAMRHAWCHWANDATITASNARQPAFFNSYLNNTSVTSQNGMRMECSGGLPTNQDYNQLGDTIRGNSLTGITTNGVYYRTNNAAGMIVMDDNTISGMPRGVYEDTSVNGGRLVLVNNTITGDGSGSSKAIDTTTAPAAGAMTVTQSPGSGQFSGFVA